MERSVLCREHLLQLRCVIVSLLLQLEKYKAKRSSKDKGGNTEHVEQSDDESLHNEKSMLHKESGVRGKNRLRV